MLAKEVIEAAGPSGRIACIACPSLFRQLRAQHPNARAHLFEVDLRFEVLLQIFLQSLLCRTDCTSAMLLAWHLQEQFVDNLWCSEVSSLQSRPCLVVVLCSPQYSVLERQWQDGDGPCVAGADCIFRHFQCLLVLLQDPCNQGLHSSPLFSHGEPLEMVMCLIWQSQQLVHAQTLGNFSLYDYREPRAVSEDLKGAFRVVVADPPYLVGPMHTTHAESALLTMYYCLNEVGRRLNCQCKLATSQSAQG